MLSQEHLDVWMGSRIKANLKNMMILVFIRKWIGNLAVYMETFVMIMRTLERVFAGARTI